MSKPSWSSRLSFIVTTSAFAVGLGNIWRFPYITGEGGGGAFLLVYLLLVFLVGIPILSIEIVLGRSSETTPLVGYGALSGKKGWNVLGWLTLLSNMLIMFFYIMIMAWVLIYFAECLQGNFQQMAGADFEKHFDQVTSSLVKVQLVIVGIMLAAAFIVGQGLQAGLERYTKWMMLALMLMLLALSIWASTLDGAMEGYRWFLAPDFSKITLEVVLSALGQLFFSVGVAMGVAFAFGSYTQKSDNLVYSSVWVVLSDTIFAIIAGLMIFPALFSFGLSPDSGPNLIFITMASMFAKIEYGSWLGAAFFFLLFLAGFTSLITSIQGQKDSFKDKYSLSSRQALVLVTVLFILGSVPAVWSYTEDPILIRGNNFFEVLDYLTSTIMLPLGGLLIAIFGAHVIGYEKLKEQVLVGAGKLKIGDYWKFIIRWLLPLALLIILINGLLKS